MMEWSSDTKVMLICGAAILVVVLLCIAALRHDTAHPFGHVWRYRTAKRLYARLRSGEIRQEAALRYLRTIDPFVFEELVLYAYSRCGYRTRRNSRYTGDGGIDGRMRGHGDRWLLQMKRYGGYVDTNDVKAFSELCRNRRRRGAFVHTGRTGMASWEEAARQEGVEIVSGKLLVGLLCHGEDPVRARKF